MNEDIAMFIAYVQERYPKTPKVYEDLVKRTAAKEFEVAKLSLQLRIAQQKAALKKRKLKLVQK